MIDKARVWFDPLKFAVMQSRMTGVISEMTEVILATARNPILYAARDFTCAVLSKDGRLIAMADGLPMHLFALDSALQAIIAQYEDDIHDGDCFALNDPYSGNTHVGDLTMFAPIVDGEEVLCWVGALCHTIDSGAYIPTNVDPLARDAYEEGLHIPPMRIAANFQPLSEFVRLIRANFRYPDGWHSDFLAQLSAVWAGVRRIKVLALEEGCGNVLAYTEQAIAYGDTRMRAELSKLPAGTWWIEGRTDPVGAVAPEGVLLKVGLTIEPQNGRIIYDLREMPDQLEWGYNLSYACTKGACLEATIPCLDPALPRNAGVFSHIDVLAREGSVAGRPRWPAATACATTGVADVLANLILRMWNMVEVGRGHAEAGYVTPLTSWVSGLDARRDDEPYGHSFNIALSGGGASQGSDGWPMYFCNAIMGNMKTESVELTELTVPCLVWEVAPEPDSGGVGQWHGGPSIRIRIQPCEHPMHVVAYGMGTKVHPAGLSGGMAGMTARHWIENASDGQVIRELSNTAVFDVQPGEVWVGRSNGGGGYGDPALRSATAIRRDVENELTVTTRTSANTASAVAGPAPSRREAL